jgi:ADP-L-glycero-D-manno-heptose 6-epimerase
VYTGRTPKTTARQSLALGSFVIPPVLWYRFGMPRYLLSGAAGFIGSNLALELQARGHEVVAVDSLRTGARENLAGFRGRFVQADVTEPLALEGPWDGVFHHGDITDPRHGSDSEVLERNVAGFGRMLELASQSGCRLVYASTAGLYGNGPTPMHEDQAKQLITAYGRSKQQMDSLAAAHTSTPVVGLRYFNVYGPREAGKGRAASMVYHLFRQIQQGQAPKLFEWGEQVRDFIHVHDVVSANLCAMTAPSGVYNVGTGVGSTFNQLVEVLGLALGQSIKPQYIPMAYDPATYQSNTVADTTRARTQLGFTARWNLREGVADYIHWLKQQ